MVSPGNEIPHQYSRILAVKLAIQTFTKYKDVKAIHLQVDNIVALKYLIKIGGTQNLKMVALAKEI